MLKPKTNEYFMDMALREAKKAFDIGETPIGAVIVRANTIIARAHNERTLRGNALAHAEIIAINKACKKCGDWRLEDCTLFVTLEPCPMCAGAIVEARIPTVYIGSKSLKAGSAGTIVDLFNEPKFNHQVKAIWGIREAECSKIMSDFFKDLRKRHPVKTKYKIKEEF